VSPDLFAVHAKINMAAKWIQTGNDKRRHKLSSRRVEDLLHEIANDAKNVARSVFSRLSVTLLTAENLVEGATKVRIEDVIDNRIQHGATVLQPLEHGDRLWRYVRLATLTRAAHYVGGEEWQVERDEHSKEDAKHTDGTTTTICCTAAVYECVYITMTSIPWLLRAQEARLACCVTTANDGFGTALVR